jgi:hypothetical protein
MAIPSEAKLDLGSESEAGTRAIEFVSKHSGGSHKRVTLKNEQL